MLIFIYMFREDETLENKKLQTLLDEINQRNITYHMVYFESQYYDNSKRINVAIIDEQDGAMYENVDDALEAIKKIKV